MAAPPQTHQGQPSNPDEKPFAFGYMLLPEHQSAPEDAAAQEREFQIEIQSLENLFASDPYGGIPPGRSSSFAAPHTSDLSQHQFTFTVPPTVHAVDAVYFDQQSHLSSMTAPYMGMHNPSFEFAGFDPQNPYTPTGEVTHSFAGLNMQQQQMGNGSHHGAPVMNSIDSAMNAGTPDSLQSTTLKSTPTTKYEDPISPGHVGGPNPDSFFSQYPEARRPSNAPAAASSLFRFPHFGSDPSFSEQRGFARPTEASTFAHAVEKRDQITRFAFQTTQNEGNTPPTSPKPRRPSALQNMLRGDSADSEQSPHPSSAAQAKRRRLGTPQDVSSTSDDERASDSEMREGESPPRNRRKSSAAGAAATARRNLTEEQRRQNHNKSEQRRRTVITDDLTLVRNLVPALINTTASKAIAIRETYQFLYDLLEGNKEMEQMLGPEIARAGPFPSADFTRPGVPEGGSYGQAQ